MQTTTSEEKGRPGRKHLDGSDPGEGEYLPRLSVTVRPEDMELLERMGRGNRSRGLRSLLDQYRVLTEGAVEWRNGGTEHLLRIYEATEIPSVVYESVEDAA